MKAWKTKIAVGAALAMVLPSGPSARGNAAAKPPAKADANFIASAADLKARIPSQLHITRPDYVVFVPEVVGDTVSDTGNEHFLVFDGPDGSLMAVWTQSSAEAQPDQHIAFSRSTDEGVTWSKPRIIAGPKKAGAGPIASWAYPLVSASGRIYVLYSQHIRDRGRQSQGCRSEDPLARLERESACGAVSGPSGSQRLPGAIDREIARRPAVRRDAHRLGEPVLVRQRRRRRDVGAAAAVAAPRRRRAALAPAFAVPDLRRWRQHGRQRAVRLVHPQPRRPLQELGKERLVFRVNAG
jgi:hypothetical protein